MGETFKEKERIKICAEQHQQLWQVSLLSVQSSDHGLEQLMLVNGFQKHKTMK